MLGRTHGPQRTESGIDSLIKTFWRKQLDIDYLGQLFRVVRGYEMKHFFNDLLFFLLKSPTARVSQV